MPALLFSPDDVTDGALEREMSAFFVAAVRTCAGTAVAANASPTSATPLVDLSVAVTVRLPPAAVVPKAGSTVKLTTSPLAAGWNVIASVAVPCPFSADAARVTFVALAVVVDLPHVVAPVVDATAR